MYLSFKKQKRIGMLMGRRPWNDYKMWHCHWLPCIYMLTLFEPQGETVLFSSWQKEWNPFLLMG